jgi:choline dehydrogenase-like flavoprotein
LLGEDGYKPTGKTARVRARTFVVSGGAINSPALLLRSGLDAGGLVGRRTFLHPVIASIAEYDEPIEAFYGAPQTAVSHAFAHRGDKVGVFLEAAPAYPMVGATAIPSFGELHRAWMTRFNHLAIHIAISIDGFHDDVQGGTVRLRPSGAPLLDYPLVPRQWEAFRFAQDKLARVQLASGAKRAMTLHDPGIVVESEKDLPKLESARWEPCSVGIFTAHQMGGCAMGDDPSKSVVRSEDLRMHDVANLHVIDGSVFPTSLGVNPQESILGLSRLMATRLAATK